MRRVYLDSCMVIYLIENAGSLGLQDGAKRVATTTGIYEVHLDKNSTTTDYLLRFLNQVCIGFSDTSRASQIP